MTSFVSDAIARRAGAARAAIGGAVVVVTAAALTLVGATSAAATTPSVSATAAAWTPYVLGTNAAVYQLAQCNATMYAVGSFPQAGGKGKPTVTRNNAFAFSATTGAIAAWNPNLNGAVNAISLSADCSTAYLGGSFTKVGGTAVTNLAKVSTTTGLADASFKPAPNGAVLALQAAAGRLFVGGQFSAIAGTSRPALATLRPTTGAIDGYSAVAIAGTLPNSSRKVWSLRLSHGGTKLLANGSFLTVAGQTRRQVFMLDLGSSAVTLDAWYAPDLTLACTSSEPLYAKGIAWSPDDQYVYTASTGYRGASPLCDGTAKFAASARGNQAPLWINLTGCDSLFSVVADDSNVYVGGHQRWLGNPKGCDNAGPGALSRPGIGSLNAANGSVTAWNPTRSRGHAVNDMVLTPAGLWVADDNEFSSYNCAGVYHPGICFFPR
jgi:hypothetical protein